MSQFNVSSSVSEMRFHEPLDRKIYEAFGYLPRQNQKRAAEALTRNQIVRLGTGEGKTLSIALGAAKLIRKGYQVHILTANDYLAQRDHQAFLEFFRSNEMRSGLISQTSSQKDREVIYLESDVIYSTMTEVAFDILRDRVSFTSKIQSTKKLFAIIDEADSLLIDEATTPFVLSAEASQDDAHIQLIQKISDWTKLLSSDHVVYEEGFPWLTDEGYASFERFFVQLNPGLSPSELYRHRYGHYLNMLQKALIARFFLKKDVDYVVSDNEIKLINQLTGRLSFQSRWADGLHQALEAFNNIEIKKNLTEIASISSTGVLAFYSGISGITGTVQEISDELLERYHLKTVIVPDHFENCVEIGKTYFFRNKHLKFEAIRQAIIDNVGCRPILIGAESVKESEEISDFLLAKNIQHVLLNAKNHYAEAEFLKAAGLPGAITISTNMAGRGTDIILGAGNEAIKSEVIRAGGLKVLAASRQRNKRLDFQLAGRAGRQGEPGEVIFFSCPEDGLFQNIPDHLKEAVMKSTDFLDDRLVSRIQSFNYFQEFRQRANAQKLNSVIEVQSAIYYDIRRSWLNAGDANSRVMKLCGYYLCKIYHEYFHLDEEDRALSIRRFLIKNTSLNKNDIKHIATDSEKDFLASCLDLIKNKNYNGVNNKSIVMFMDEAWRSHVNYIKHMQNASVWYIYCQQNPDIAFYKEACEQFRLFHDKLYLDVSMMPLSNI